MKRAGGLIEEVVDLENLKQAFCRAAKGKRDRPSVRAFACDLDGNLAGLREWMLRGNVALGEYTCFRIRDPKERLICAAAFRERVLHHALMGPCEAVFERALIHHTYACREGKGQTGALAAALRNARQFGFFLKLDIRKYFDSVDQTILLRALARRFKDVAVVRLFERLLATYSTAPGKGLPIGNLTSQFFANFYLDPLDRFILESCGCGGYVRYMDDSVVWDEDRDRLRALRDAIVEFLRRYLALELKERSPVHRVEEGLSFLGFRVFPSGLRLDGHSRKRLVRKYCRYQAEFRDGEWSEREYQQRLEALFAFARQADSREFRIRLLRRHGDFSDYY